MSPEGGEILVTFPVTEKEAVGIGEAGEGVIF